MGWTHIEDSQPVARKAHRCCLCGRAIDKGSQYINRFGYNGEPVTMKMHLICEEVTTGWEDDSQWECSEGEFREQLVEYLKQCRML